MYDNLLSVLRNAISRRWNARLRGILEDAQAANDARLSPGEAYQAGYSAAYFDAIADLVEEGILKDATHIGEKLSEPRVPAEGACH